jgi:uncharacterized protein (DUF433 family)
MNSVLYPPSKWYNPVIAAAGQGYDAVLSSYPGLKREDIQAAVTYAAELSRDRIIMM